MSGSSMRVNRAVSPEDARALRVARTANPEQAAATVAGDVWTNIAIGRRYTVLAVRDDYVRVTHPPHGKGYWMTVASLHRHYRKEV